MLHGPTYAAPEKIAWMTDRTHSEPYNSGKRPRAACAEPLKRGVRPAPSPSSGLFSRHGQSRLEVQESCSEIKVVCFVADEGAIRRHRTQDGGQEPGQTGRKAFPRYLKKEGESGGGTGESRQVGVHVR